MKRAIAALALIAFIFISTQSAIPSAITTSEGKVLFYQGAPLVVRGGEVYTHEGERLTTLSGEKLILGMTQVEAPEERLGVKVSLSGVRQGLGQVVTEDGRGVFYFKEGKKLVTSDFEEVVAGGKKIEVEEGYALTWEYKRLLQIFTLSAVLFLISEPLAGAFGLLALLLSFGYADLSRAVFRDALVFFLAYSFVLSSINYKRSVEEASSFTSAFLSGLAFTEEKCRGYVRGRYTAALAASAFLLPISSFYNLFLVELLDGAALIRWLSISLPLAIALLLVYLLVSRALNFKESLNTSFNARAAIPFAFVLLAGSFLGYGIASLILAIALLAMKKEAEVDFKAIPFAFLLAIMILLHESGAGFYLGNLLVNLASSLPFSGPAAVLLVVMLSSLVLSNLIGKGYALALSLPATYGMALLGEGEFFVLGMAALIAASLHLGSENRDVAAIVYVFGFLFTIIYLTIIT
jgi:hypothetical protein